MKVSIHVCCVWPPSMGSWPSWQVEANARRGGVCPAGSRGGEAARLQIMGPFLSLTLSLLPSLPRSCSCSLSLSLSLSLSVCPHRHIYTSWRHIYVYLTHVYACMYTLRASSVVLLHVMPGPVWTREAPASAAGSRGEEAVLFCK